jgi:CRISPR-associated endoribonuclease Cas2 subtype I-E
MKIVIVENCSTKIKGILNRYFIRIDTGVYISNRVNRRLFEQITSYIKEQGAKDFTKSIFINEDNKAYYGVNVQYNNYLTPQNMSSKESPCFITIL